jgi:hypothetical protein
VDNTYSQGAAGSQERRRRGSIVGPIVLILLGVLFLGQSLGWFAPTIWSTLLSLWPVLLILIGVELILGRGSWVGALVLGLVVIGLVGLFSFAATIPWSSGGVRVGSFAPVETIQMTEEMGQTKRATYQLEFGAGSMNVSALSSGSTNLLEATLEREENATIERNADRQGDLTRVTIRGHNTDPVTRPGNVGRTRMAVSLSPQTPSELRVNGGAGDLDLRLTALPITYFELNAGVGGSKIVLPQSAGRTSARVSVGIGGVDVTIPEGVAAQITVDKGIGGGDIDQSRFPKVGGDTYRSANYDNAANRVDLYVSGGIGGTTIR